MRGSVIARLSRLKKAYVRTCKDTAVFKEFLKRANEREILILFQSEYTQIVTTLNYHVKTKNLI